MVHRPILYTLYTADNPLHLNTLLASFADETAILTSNPNPIFATQILLEHLSLIEKWYQHLKIKKSKTIIHDVRNEYSEYISVAFPSLTMTLSDSLVSIWTHDLPEKNTPK